MFVSLATQPGDVYVLDQNQILIYGNQGIALRISQRNIASFQAAMQSRNAVKDRDIKDRSFSVRYDTETETFEVAVLRGDRVYVNAELLVQRLELAA